MLFCSEGLPENVLNMWRGFSVEARQGDWHLMQAHIRDVLADGDPEAERYILDWAACERPLRLQWRPDRGGA